MIRYVFLLLPGFSAFDLTAAVEPLKDANRQAEDQIYLWALTTEDGQKATASNGFHIEVDGALTHPDRHDRVIVLAGEDYESKVSRTVLNWLRRANRTGAFIGAISSGVYALLKAGVMRPTEISTHWSYRAALQEMFEGLDVRRSVFLHDDNRASCAGGVATLDLMLHFIAQDHGTELATAVADSLVCSQPRTAAHEQTISQSSRVGDRNAKVIEAVEIMMETLEAPISPAQIADEIGISTRQLERLFGKYLNASPKAYYMKLRLEHARSLLLQTNMKVIDVAMAAGFNSPSHFSKLYRKQFSITPYKERGFSKASKGERER